MLHIIGMILKMLGIIIGGLFAVVLFFLFLVLFCPIRYRCKIRMYERKEVCLTISFFFHLFDYRVFYDNDVIKKKFRILGIEIKKGRKKKSNKKKKSKKKYNHDFEQIKSDRMDAADKIQIQENKIRVIEKEKKEKLLGTNEVLEVEDFDSLNLEENSVWTKFKRKIFLIKHKVRDIISSIKNFTHRMQEGIKTLREWKEIFDDEQLRDVLRYLKKELKLILKRWMPKQLKGNLHFGFSDPSLTGRILGALSWIYGPFSKSLVIYPDFEKKILEGTVEVKGFIQIYYFLFLGFRVYRSDELKYLKKILAENNLI